MVLHHLSICERCVELFQLWPVRLWRVAHRSHDRWSVVSAIVDAYVRQNQIALEVFADDGHSEFHGVSKRTLDAFARRGLIWYQRDWRACTGGLTAKGLAALAELSSDQALWSE